MITDSESFEIVSKVNKPPTDAPQLSGWHHAYGGQGLEDPPGSLGGTKKEDAYAPLRGPSELDRPRYKERQADHRAHRQRRRHCREAWVEVGAGLLDGRSLRHGLRLRGTQRRSPERPPTGDRLFGQRQNHHAKSVRRGGDVRVTKEAGLSR